MRLNNISKVNEKKITSIKGWICCFGYPCKNNRNNDLIFSSNRSIKYNARKDAMVAESCCKENTRHQFFTEKSRTFAEFETFQLLQGVECCCLTINLAKTNIYANWQAGKMLCLFFHPQREADSSGDEKLILSERQRSRIIKLICEQIGRYWMPCSAMPNCRICKTINTLTLVWGNKHGYFSYIYIYIYIAT